MMARRTPRPQALAAAWHEQVRLLETQRQLRRQVRAAHAQPPGDYLPVPVSPPSPPGGHRFEIVPTLPRPVCARCHVETDRVIVEGYRTKPVWFKDGVATDVEPPCAAPIVVASPAAPVLVKAPVTVDAEFDDVDPALDIVIARAPRRPRPPRSRVPRSATTSARPSRRPSRQTQAFLDGEDEAAPSDRELRRFEAAASSVHLTHADIAGEKEHELIRTFQAGLAADAKIRVDTAAAPPRLPAKDVVATSVHGRRAGDTLLRAHDPLIRMYAARCHKLASERHGVNFDDLLQEARKGFLRGISGFAPQHGAKLSTYAGYWMLQCMGRLLDKTRSLVGLPFNVLERLKRLQRKGVEVTPAAMLANQGKTPLNPEIAEHAVAVWLGRDVSVHETVGGGSEDEDEGRALRVAGYLQSDEDVSEKVIAHDIAARRKTLVDDALAKLTERQRVVAQRRLMADPPDDLESIGKDMGVSKEMVRQWELQARAALRTAMVASVRESDDAAEALDGFVDEDDDETAVLDEAA